MYAGLSEHPYLYGGLALFFIGVLIAAVVLIVKYATGGGGGNGGTAPDPPTALMFGYQKPPGGGLLPGGISLSVQATQRNRGNVYDLYGLGVPDQSVQLAAEAGIGSWKFTWQPPATAPSGLAYAWSLSDNSNRLLQQGSTSTTMALIPVIGADGKTPYFTDGQSYVFAVKSVLADKSSSLESLRITPPTLPKASMNVARSDGSNVVVYLSLTSTDSRFYQWFTFDDFTFPTPSCTGPDVKAPFNGFTLCPPYTSCTLTGCTEAIIYDPATAKLSADGMSMTFQSKPINVAQWPTNRAGIVSFSVYVNPILSDAYPWTINSSGTWSP